MKQVWFIVGLVALLLALVSLSFAETVDFPQPPDPPAPEWTPDPTGHKEPPPGWTCSNHPNAPAGHKCGCSMKCTKDDEGNVVAHFEGCSSYCFEKEHCTCSHQCESTH